MKEFEQGQEEQVIVKSVGKLGGNFFFKKGITRLHLYSGDVWTQNRNHRRFIFLSPKRFIFLSPKCFHLLRICYSKPIMDKS